MNKTNVFSWAFLLSVLAVSMGTMLGGCKSSSDVRGSRKGEECRTTNDCVSPLSCVPAPRAGGGGVCVTGEFHVTATAKECAIIACSAATDCCPTVPPGINCTQLNADCLRGSPTSFACQQYNTYCKCDGSKYSCDNGKCNSHCTTDMDCGGGFPGGLKCASGSCVACTDNSQCPNMGDTCVGGSCQPPCQSDSDCPAFNRCTSGMCTESGCKTDRECIAATRNVEAKCGKDTKCSVPCQTDLECGNPKEYSFYSCINSQCVYTGCESDKDCELYITGGSDAGTPFGRKTHIVCRDKTAR